MKKIIKNVSPWGQILVTVIVGKIKIINNKIEIDKEKISKPYNALIDTGCAQSVISQKIVSELKLNSIEKIKIQTTSDNNHEAYTYDVAIAIAFDYKINIKQTINELNENWIIKPVKVSESEAINNQFFDVILGMDIIMQGELLVQKDIFTFGI